MCLSGGVPQSLGVFMGDKSRGGTIIITLYVTIADGHFKSSSGVYVGEKYKSYPVQSF